MDILSLTFGKVALAGGDQRRLRKSWKRNGDFIRYHKNS